MNALAVMCRSEPIDASFRSEGEGCSLLLMLPLGIKFDDKGTLLFESQAANGLERWAEHFERLIVTCVRTPHAELSSRSTWTWTPVSELSCSHRVEVVPLPWACRPIIFVRHYREVRRRLREYVKQAKYLCFSISYSWGDWACLGAIEAIRQRRPYAVWTDLVDHQVIRFIAEHKPFIRRLYGKYVDAQLVQNYHHYLIRQSSLGLFHGRDCFDAYASMCPNPHLVHDIHLKRSDAIDTGQLQRKATEVEAGARIRIGYVGRVVDAKGPDDWLEAVGQLIGAGCDLEATWLGDGPLLEGMRARVQRLGLTERVHFPGFIGDRSAVLDFLKSCHICLFCHKVPESPRTLIEAMICGCPIVGYDSPYPRDLIAENRAGKFTPVGDAPALIRCVEELCRDRVATSDLIKRTSNVAETFNDEAVFRHRSELIKQYL
jgi:glycosyltransferase involved in cell wall biosynthesis